MINTIYKYILYEKIELAVLKCNGVKLKRKLKSIKKKKYVEKMYSSIELYEDKKDKSSLTSSPNSSLP